MGGSTTKSRNAAVGTIFHGCFCSVSIFSRHERPRFSTATANACRTYPPVCLTLHPVRASCFVKERGSIKHHLKFLQRGSHTSIPLFFFLPFFFVCVFYSRIMDGHVAYENTFNYNTYTYKKPICAIVHLVLSFERTPQTVPLRAPLVEHVVQQQRNQVLYSCLSSIVRNLYLQLAPRLHYYLITAGMSCCGCCSHYYYE